MTDMGNYLGLTSGSVTTESFLSDVQYMKLVFYRPSVLHCAEDISFKWQESFLSSGLASRHVSFLKL